jgi:hypothetical protein
MAKHIQLVATTPTGLALLFDAQLTGKIDLCADGFTVASIEIRMWGMCSRLTPTGSEPLPVGYANGVRQFWVRPDDLCWDGGVPIKHEELIAAAAARREEVEAMQNAILPENWP